MPNPEFICLHIAKTAGGTLKRALKDNSGVRVEFMYGAKDRQELAACNLSDTDLIYGHNRFEVHEELNLPFVPRYFRYVRPPISRTISHYHHLRNVDTSAVGDKTCVSKDINDFCDTEAL